MSKKLIVFFKLLRWFHELAVILPFLALYLVINYYAKKTNSGCQLPGFDFAIVCFCVQCLIAAGCVLNDIVDRDIDKINKPKTHIVDNSISLKNAKIIFFVLSLIILLLSIYISLNMFRQWAYISASVYTLSILYDFYFKRTPLFGNILMALLTALIPLVLLFFAKNCLEELDNEKIRLLIYLYSVFPFLIIIPRELSLDISDIEGDRACGCKTLPIIIGVKKSKQIVNLFIFLIILLSIPTGIGYPHLFWSFLIIDAQLIWYLYLLSRANARIDYIRIGRFLWFIMIFGLVMFTVSTLL